LERKIKDARFDRHQPDDDTSDECFSTDFSDMEANDIYKRYRIVQREAKEDHRMIEKKYEDYKLALKNQVVLEKGDKKAQRPWRELENELFIKKYNTTKFIERVVGYLAHMRMISNVDGMHHSDIVKDKDGNIDPILGANFDPYERLSEDAKNNPNLAPEVRKLLNQQEPELQAIENPIEDEEQAMNYVHDMEIKNAYFQAKWQWYVDKKLSAMKLTMRNVEQEREHAEQYDEWVE
jgi:hypothetical protein